MDADCDNNVCRQKTYFGKYFVKDIFIAISAMYNSYDSLPSLRGETVRAGDLRTNLKVRTTRTINIDGLRIPGGRELTVKRVEQGKAVVMFHGQEVSLQPNDLEVAP